MATDGFTISVGIVATGLFLIGKDVTTNRRCDKNHVDLRLVADLLLLMYALMSADVIISVGQAVIIAVTILFVVRQGMWSNISTGVKVIALALPSLIGLALITASTYQYRMLMPALSTSTILIGVSAYALLIGACLLKTIQRDNIGFNPHKQILFLAGPLMLMAYSVITADPVIFVINTICVFRVLHQLQRSQSGLSTVGNVK